jgi:outer membrane cobalamin receptor
MIPKHTASVALVLALYIPGHLAAQEEDEDSLLQLYGAEELISIATGKSQPIFKAPAVASVITAEQIKLMGATDLDQVLESIPGIHVSLSSLRASPVYSIRGIHTDKNPQVLMLVNGTPITQLYLGDRGTRSTLPIHNIARVEVIRGPGSAVYGADAVSGVINVITKNAELVSGLETGARAGSFDTQEAWAAFGTQYQGWNVYFGIEASTTDGDQDRIVNADAQTFFDSLPFSPSSVSLAPGALNTGHKRLDIRAEVSNDQWTFRAWNWRQEGEVGAGIGAALDPDGNVESDNYLFDVAYKGANLSKTWEYETRLSYMDINTKSQQTIFPKGTVLPIGNDGNVDFFGTTLVSFPDGFIGNPEIFEKHSKLDFTTYYSGFKKQLIRMAAGLYYSELDASESKNFGPGVLDPTVLTPPVTVGGILIIDGTLTDVTNTDFIFIQDQDRTVHYLSIQDEWSITGDWALTAGLRYDEYSDFGSTLNPRVALVWEAKQNLTAKLLYGKAFRAPSFAELFAINNPVVLGNPDLDPEVIDTYEIAFDYRPNFDLRTGLNIFYYELEDLIEFAQDPGMNTQSAQNVGTQSGHGFELEFNWSPKETITLSGHYAYQQSEDERNNEDSGNTPEQQIYLDVTWKFIPDWFVSTQVYWIGDRNREFGDTREEIDDYSMMDLNIGCSCIIPGLDLSVTVKNLLDEDAYEPSTAELKLTLPRDYPLAGQSAYLQANYRF